MMKHLKEILITSSVIIASIFSLIFFKSIPSANLWKGYSVLYVPEKDAGEKVLNALYDTVCKDIICLENQYVPLSAKFETPEVSLSVSGMEKSDYLNRRKLYFFDKSKEFRVYYIPEIYEKNIQDASEYLSSQKIVTGVNVSSTYPFIVPLICFLFAVFCLLHSDSKKLFASLAILPVLYAFSFSFYSITPAICFLLYIAFMSIKVWKRRNAVSYLIRHVVLLALGIMAILYMFLSGIKLSIIFVLLVAAELCVAKLFSVVEQILDEKCFFIPVKIIPANFISIQTVKTNFCLFALSGLLCLIFVFSVISTRVSFTGNNSSQIMLPGSHGTGGSLPDLDDYVNWTWETITYPYVSVYGKNPKAEKGSSVKFTTYKMEDNRIIPEEKFITYDENFSENVKASVEKLNFPAVEKMLKKQGKVNPGFTSGSGQAVTGITIFTLLLSISITFSFAIVSKTKYKRQLIIHGGVI